MIVDIYPPYMDDPIIELTTQPLHIGLKIPSIEASIQPTSITSDLQCCSGVTFRLAFLGESNGKPDLKTWLISPTKYPVQEMWRKQSVSHMASSKEAGWIRTAPAVPINKLHRYTLIIGSSFPPIPFIFQCFLFILFPKP
jgi:hypothetical protein